ncbi:transcriptional regulator [Elizabethkingia anophelis]|uniref:transcriptional regulator n=1 Tax=Elizabethkingia anophelis TaxID=1117645 RepID=UPI003787032F
MAKKGRLTNEQRDRLQEHARLLYTKENITSHKELAEKTGVSEKTISEWITTGNWKKYKRNTILTREEQLINLQDELVEINEAIKAKPEGARFADSKVANVRRYLIKDIKDLEHETGIKETVDVLTLFINEIKKDNKEDAQLIGKYAHAYIQSKLR